MDYSGGVAQAELPFGGASAPCGTPTETYEVNHSEGCVTRRVVLRDGGSASSRITHPACSPDARASHDCFDSAWLRAPERPPWNKQRGVVRLVDLFSGCGALSLGVAEACRALNLGLEHALAVDIDVTALAVYERNFPGARTCSSRVETIFAPLDAQLSPDERALRDSLGNIDLLVGGPPCQGNSDLNNYTRRRDSKNALFSTVIRCAQVLEPEHIIIENVPGVRHDRGSVTHAARKALERMGYNVAEAVLLAVAHGVPQRRRRYIMAASRRNHVSLRELPHVGDERTLRWACGDLANMASTRMIDSHAASSRDNRRRIEYLFKHDLYDLPDEMRPACHRDKKHSYRSVYGRLHWDEPAPTITSGFNSPGQGRFVHPDEPRTLTPHEAARIQFLPDFFDWGSSKREALTQMIGNAVPPKLGYVVALELLR